MPRRARSPDKGGNVQWLLCVCAVARATRHRSYFTMLATERRWARAFGERIPPIKIYNAIPVRRSLPNRVRLMFLHETNLGTSVSWIMLTCTVVRCDTSSAPIRPNLYLMELRVVFALRPSPRFGYIELASGKHCHLTPQTHRSKIK